MDNYKILHDNDLFDKDIKAHRYIQSKHCEEYTMSKYCFNCGTLAQLDFISHFGNTWTQHNIHKLYEIVIASLKNCPGHTKLIELQQLYKYVEKEIRDHSYYATINKYPALGYIIEVVKAHGLEH
ncbi:14907_t:CDS:2 [Gigaspora margarita]|uniref:14907_t:CDS:1 n=1 Tax=Gigaspora margarita TaxID=4874 RepID=A0ABN7V4Z6_GIGMA|nr:14907_t:CDS:2 [Gigaspora margarita]